MPPVWCSEFAVPMRRSVINRYAEAETPLPPGADHHGSLNRLSKPELDVGVWKCSLARSVHFHRRQIERSPDQRRAR